MSILGSIFNSYEKKLKSIEARAERIIALEDKMAALSDDEMRRKTMEFKEMLEGGQSLDGILEEAFALVREASFRVLGMKHFKVQIMGGIVLHEGNISEMKTGEGKTLVSTLPAYLNALTGDGVFVITVNDYLAQRDREEMGRVHEFLGLSVGFIHRELSPGEKKLAYECDITYGTNSEFGFDYLRDNMAVVKENVVQRSRNYAIIDEVDSILIDEARTPLIITGQGNRPSQYYKTVDLFVKSLKKEEHYDLDGETRIISLNDGGMDKVEKFFGLRHIADSANMELLHHIRQSLHANYVMRKDQDYVVKDGEIMIVDKFTGRLMPGRRFSNGLHQAIEAKEGVEIQKESNTNATITYQNYFRMFNKISGMTGTAYTERSELKEIYGMEVVAIPTNRPLKRVDREDKLFASEKAKTKAIVEEIKQRHEKGQPVLVGSIYIDQSEILSEQLSKMGIKHKLLNAKQDKDEAGIISMAGQKGAVTIATNMAGRGTDIKLGEGVEELGGLYVLGTERHDSRRIDNQLRGRSGRQGDSGESQFFISLEDSLFEKIEKDKLDRIWRMVEKAGFTKEDYIDDVLISKAVENVQATVEANNYRIRKSTLEFDKILNKQRETIYKERNDILNGEDKSEFIKSIIADVIKDAVSEYTSVSEYPEEWDIQGLEEHLNDSFVFAGRAGLSELTEEEIEALDSKKLEDMVVQKGLEIYAEKEEAFEEKELRYVERLTLMRSIDKGWIEHLDLVEQMRQGIYMQIIGQQDPVRAFNKEAFSMFEAMMESIKRETVRMVLSLATKEMVEKDLEEKMKLLAQKGKHREEERAERVGELEDKYKFSRKHVIKVPANLPVISLNVDINATEEISAEYALYYMDNGFEEKIESHSKKLTVTGKFPVHLEKPKDKDWLKGWHQVKVFVAGQEASIINFIVDEPADLEALKRKQEERRSVSQSVRFFSNKKSMIAFDMNFPKYDGDSISAALAFPVKGQEPVKFEVPVKDSKALLKLQSPGDGWKNGFYQLILQPKEGSAITMPFMVVDEHSKDETITIGLNFDIKQQLQKDAAENAGQELDGEKPQVRFIGQVVHIETQKAVANVPIIIQNSGKLNLKFDPGEKGWDKGRYEFRVIGQSKVIMTRHFMVS
ncbi:protein translocase subunit secA [Peptoclostridium litorale DSM 5388]|uniref:Protein translocase subunit SecA n=1 Tax=Peptoclostridium litorale DSM 5388 TaxID=1121324 RepID=A0A069RFI3_PEPLI|nr:preprotein translocase subunit SecA [Peptoclostridium litorale]KDR94955.1 protein translocase subunit SecA [Peptoclostridium litorale DSM 5388]SIO33842.1 protein translocase subunit secA [Peptoclostridium litorale DSM 5388]